jgi:hypothetical protein
VTTMPQNSTAQKCDDPGVRSVPSVSTPLEEPDMTDTTPAAAIVTTALVRVGHEHVLAQARVRSLAARPVGPMKVRRAHGHSAHAR